MPAVLPKEAIENAYAAVEHARAVRRYHRRRTHRASNQRALDIQVALDVLKSAMAPLRSEIGRFPYGPQTDEAETHRDVIRAASQAIQRERRKLFKMR